MEVWVLAVQTTLPTFFGIMFSGHRIKNVTHTTFCCWLFSLGPGNITHRPKNHVFEMRWTWFSGSTWEFSGAKHNSHQSWKFNAKGFVMYPKDIMLNYWSNFFGRTARQSLFWLKNHGRLYFNFVFWLKVSPTNISAIKKHEKWGVLLLNAKSIHFQPAIPSLFLSAWLPLIKLVIFDNFFLCIIGSGKFLLRL